LAGSKCVGPSDQTYCHRGPRFDTSAALPDWYCSADDEHDEGIGRGEAQAVGLAGGRGVGAAAGTRTENDDSTFRVGYLSAAAMGPDAKQQKATRDKAGTHWKPEFLIFVFMVGVTIQRRDNFPVIDDLPACQALAQKRRLGTVSASMSRSFLLFWSSA